MYFVVLYYKARKGGFLKKNNERSEYIFLNLVKLCFCLTGVRILKFASLKIKFMSRLSNYILETKGEMKHVSWPTKNQTIMYTMLVILISIVISAYLGFFDYLFSLGLKSLI